MKKSCLARTSKENTSRMHIFWNLLGWFGGVLEWFQNAESRCVFTRLNQVSKITSEHSVHSCLLGCYLVIARINLHISQQYLGQSTVPWISKVLQIKLIYPSLSKSPTTQLYWTENLEGDILGQCHQAQLGWADIIKLYYKVKLYSGMYNIYFWSQCETDELRSQNKTISASLPATVACELS